MRQYTSADKWPTIKVTTTLLSRITESVTLEIMPRQLMPNITRAKTVVIGLTKTEDLEWERRTLVLFIA